MSLDPSSEGTVLASVNIDTERPVRRRRWDVTLTLTYKSFAPREVVVESFWRRSRAIGYAQLGNFRQTINPSERLIFIYSVRRCTR